MPKEKNMTVEQANHVINILIQQAREQAKEQAEEQAEESSVEEPNQWPLAGSPADKEYWNGMRAIFQQFPYRQWGIQTAIKRLATLSHAGQNHLFSHFGLSEQDALPLFDSFSPLEEKNKQSASNIVSPAKAIHKEEAASKKGYFRRLFSRFRKLFPSGKTKKSQGSVLSERILTINSSEEDVIPIAKEHVSSRGILHRLGWRRKSGLEKRGLFSQGRKADHGPHAVELKRTRKRARIVPK